MNGILESEWLLLNIHHAGGMSGYVQICHGIAHMVKCSAHCHCGYYLKLIQQNDWLHKFCYTSHTYCKHSKRDWKGLEAQYFTDKDNTRIMIRITFILLSPMDTA